MANTSNVNKDKISHHLQRSSSSKSQCDLVIREESAEVFQTTDETIEVELEKLEGLLDEEEWGESNITVLSVMKIFEGTEDETKDTPSINDEFRPASNQHHESSETETVVSDTVFFDPYERNNSDNERISFESLLHEGSCQQNTESKHEEVVSKCPDVFINIKDSNGVLRHQRSTDSNRDYGTVQDENFEKDVVNNETTSCLEQTFRGTNWKWRPESEEAAQSLLDLPSLGIPKTSRTSQVGLSVSHCHKGNVIMGDVEKQLKPSNEVTARKKKEKTCTQEKNQLGMTSCYGDGRASSVDEMMVAPWFSANDFQEFHDNENPTSVYHSPTSSYNDVMIETNKHVEESRTEILISKNNFFDQGKINQEVNIPKPFERVQSEDEARVDHSARYIMEQTQNEDSIVVKVGIMSKARKPEIDISDEGSHENSCEKTKTDKNIVDGTNANIPSKSDTVSHHPWWNIMNKISYNSEPMVTTQDFLDYKNSCKHMASQKCMTYEECISETKRDLNIQNCMPETGLQKRDMENATTTTNFHNGKKFTPDNHIGIYNTPDFHKGMEYTPDFHKGMEYTPDLHKGVEYTPDFQNGMEFNLNSQDAEILCTRNTEMNKDRNGLLQVRDEKITENGHSLITKICLENSGTSPSIDTSKSLQKEQLKNAIEHAKSVVNEYTSRLEHISEEVGMVLKSHGNVRKINKEPNNETDYCLDCRDETVDKVSEIGNVENIPIAPQQSCKRYHKFCEQHEETFVDECPFSDGNYSRNDCAYSVRLTASEVTATLNQVTNRFLDCENRSVKGENVYDFLLVLRENQIVVEIKREMDDKKDTKNETENPPKDKDDALKRSICHIKEQPCATNQPDKIKLLEDVVSYTKKERLPQNLYTNNNCNKIGYSLPRLELKLKEIDGSRNAFFNESAFKYAFGRNMNINMNETIFDINNNGILQSRLVKSTNACDKDSLDIEQLGSSKNGTFQIGHRSSNLHRNTTGRRISLKFSEIEARPLLQRNVDMKRVQNGTTANTKPRPQSWIATSEDRNIETGFHQAAGEGFKNRVTLKTKNETAQDCTSPNENKPVFYAQRNNENAPQRVGRNETMCEPNDFKTTSNLPAEEISTPSTFAEVYSSNSYGQPENRKNNKKRRTHKFRGNNHEHIPERNDFPLRLLVCDLRSDIPSQETTRRITIEAPSSNTLIQTFTNEINSSEDIQEFELSSRKWKWYPEEKSDFVNTDDETRRLILEYDCFACRREHGNRLDLENGTLWLTETQTPETDEMLQSFENSDASLSEQLFNACAAMRDNIDGRIKFNETRLEIDNQERHTEMDIDGESAKSPMKISSGEDKIIRSTGSSNKPHENGNSILNLGNAFERIDLLRNTYKIHRSFVNNGNNNSVTLYHNSAILRSMGSGSFQEEGSSNSTRTEETIHVGQCSECSLCFRCNNGLMKANRSIQRMDGETMSDDVNCNNSSAENVQATLDSDDTTLREITQISSEISNTGQGVRAKNPIRVLEPNNFRPSLEINDDGLRKYERGSKEANEAVPINTSGKLDVEWPRNIEKLFHEDDDSKGEPRKMWQSCQQNKPISHEEDLKAKVDSYIQVVATDINVTDDVQTGDSLQMRKPDLPVRSYKTQSIIRANRKPHLCECENQLDSDIKSSAGSLRENGMQVDADIIYCSRDIQTSDSLIFEGPTCKWDYKLRKVKYAQTDIYQDCIVCENYDKHSQKLDERDMKSQVTATDIGIDESLQTGHSLKLRSPSLDPQPRQSIRRNLYKSKHLEDCECPDLEDRMVLEAEEDKENVRIQVQPLHICVTQTTQTGDPLKQADIVATFKDQKNGLAHFESIDIEPISSNRKVIYESNHTPNKTELKNKDIFQQTQKDKSSSLLLLLLREQIKQRNPSNTRDLNKRIKAYLVQYANDCEEPKFTDDESRDSLMENLCTQVMALDISPDGSAQTGSSLLINHDGSAQNKGSLLIDNDGSAQTGRSLHRMTSFIKEPIVTMTDKRILRSDEKFWRGSKPTDTATFHIQSHADSSSESSGEMNDDKLANCVQKNSIIYIYHEPHHERDISVITPVVGRRRSQCRVLFEPISISVKNYRESKLNSRQRRVSYRNEPREIECDEVESNSLNEQSQIDANFPCGFTQMWNGDTKAYHEYHLYPSNDPKIRINSSVRDRCNDTRMKYSTRHYDDDSSFNMEHENLGKVNNFRQTMIRQPFGRTQNCDIQSDHVKFEIPGCKRVLYRPIARQRNKCVNMENDFYKYNSSKDRNCRARKDCIISNENDCHRQIFSRAHRATQTEIITKCAKMVKKPHYGNRPSDVIQQQTQRSFRRNKNNSIDLDQWNIRKIRQRSFDRKNVHIHRKQGPGLLKEKFDAALGIREEISQAHNDHCLNVGSCYSKENEKGIRPNVAITDDLSVSPEMIHRDSRNVEIITCFTHKKDKERTHFLNLPSKDKLQKNVIFPSLYKKAKTGADSLSQDKFIEFTDRQHLRNSAATKAKYRNISITPVTAIHENQKLTEETRQARNTPRFERKTIYSTALNKNDIRPTGIKWNPQRATSKQTSQKKDFLETHKRLRVCN